METMLRPYPSYALSALRWIEQCPSGWEMVRVKALLREVDDRSRTGWETLLSLRQQRGLVPHNEVSDRPIPASALIGYKRVQPGDLVVNRMRASTGLVAAATEAGLVSPDYAVFRPRRSLNLNYIVSLFTTPYLQSLFRSESKGLGTGSSGFLRLYSEDLEALKILVPPREAQDQIAKYIKRVKRDTDRLIRTKLRLIALLNEQKQAIIQRAVTRGLDLDVPLKPSGVDWLGDVPEHWSIIKLKYLTQFNNGFAFKPGDWRDVGVPIIRIQNLNGSESFNYTTRNDVPERLRVQSGDLLFAWSGNRGTSFGSFTWDRPFDGFLNQHIFKLDGYNLNRRYFHWMLQAVTQSVEEQTHGIIGLVHINRGELGSIKVPVPPVDEQVDIAAEIDREVEGIEGARVLAAKEIGLIREYRTRLIADVVTGKLDVRGVVVPDVDDEEASVDLELSEDDASILDEEALADASR